jgi:hypothetical protein
MKTETTVTGEPLGFDGTVDKYLWNELYDFPHLLNTSYDVFGLIFGLEGAGKSELAMQIGAFTDPNFDLDNVVFTSQQFKDAVTDLPPGSTIVWDEADEVSDHHASKKVKLLKKFSKRMRKENKVCVLVQPVLFDQNRYWVMHRARFGIKIKDYPEKRKKSEQRGFLDFYGPKRLKRFYIDGKKEYWNQNVGNPNWQGRFYHLTDRPGFPVSIGGGTAYDQKKTEATEKLKDQGEKNVIAGFTVDDLLHMWDLVTNKSKLAEKIGINRNSLYDRVKRLKGES